MASYKIIVSWKLKFPMKKKTASSETVPNSFYSAVKYWCQPDQWKECDVRDFTWNVSFPPLPPKFQRGQHEFILYGKRFDIFYIRASKFIKQPLCDNCNFSLTTSFLCPSSLYDLGESVYFILTRRHLYFINSQGTLKRTNASCAVSSAKLSLTLIFRWILIICRWMSNLLPWLIVRIAGNKN